MSSVPTTFEGPVCNLNNRQNVIQPTAATLPQIPLITDLASAINAGNVMRQIIQALLNQLPDLANNVAQLNPDLKPTGATAFAVGGGDFKQSNLTTKKVRVTNPSDSTQYVDVEQVTGVTWKNGLGQKVTYSNP
jgi:hypothetical protein